MADRETRHYERPADHQGPETAVVGGAGAARRVPKGGTFSLSASARQHEQLLREGYIVAKAPKKAAVSAQPSQGSAPTRKSTGARAPRKAPKKAAVSAPEEKKEETHA